MFTLKPSCVRQSLVHLPPPLRTFPGLRYSHENMSTQNDPVATVT